MKTLKTIQVLAKIGKVLSAVLFVLCIVLFCIAAAGIVSLAVIGEGALVINGVSIKSLIQPPPEASVSIGDLYFAAACVMAFCAAEAVLAGFAKRYFARELADGTPFTRRGAEELLRLGVLVIVLPVCVSLLCLIAGAILALLGAGSFETSQTGVFSSVGLGVAMIVVSLLCRHGAELGETAADAPAEGE